VKATPSGGSNVPLTPAAALKLYMQHMTLYEQGEILDYPQVCLPIYFSCLVSCSLSISLSLCLIVCLSVYLSYRLFLFLLPSNMPFHASLD